MQDEQFKTEIKNLEAQQHSAYDQIRFHRLVRIELNASLSWIMFL
jgi:hypothetical protein